jgi:predicted dinucleotide-binding enzyme
VRSPEGSIAAEVKAVVPDARVVAAFHLVPAALLADISHPLVGDVLVVGDEEGRPVVLDLVDSIPDLRAFDAGSLENAVGLETFSAALLTVNLRHKGEGSLHIEGVGPRSTA